MRDYLLLNTFTDFFTNHWGWMASIVYIIALVLICLRIIYDTRSNAKALAYLMLVIFVPVLGMFLYFSVGINHRKHKKKVLQVQYSRAFNSHMRVAPE